MPIAPVSKNRFEPAAALWIIGVVVASLALSTAFACATPFVAAAAFGALTLRGREAAALVLGVWLGNQAIGFGLLHYPQDFSTLAWGGAIGIASVAALAVAQGIIGTGRLPVLAKPVLALIAAFAAYEFVLYAATWFLSSGPDAFAPAIVSRIFLVNAVAFGLLIAARRLAALAGVFPGAVSGARA